MDRLTCGQLNHLLGEALLKNPKFAAMQFLAPCIHAHGTSVPLAGFSEEPAGTRVDEVVHESTLAVKALSWLGSDATKAVQLERARQAQAALPCQPTADPHVHVGTRCGMLFDCGSVSAGRITAVDMAQAVCNIQFEDGSTLEDVEINDTDLFLETSSNPHNTPLPLNATMPNGEERVVDSLCAPAVELSDMTASGAHAAKKHFQVVEYRIGPLTALSWWAVIAKQANETRADATRHMGHAVLGDDNPHNPKRALAARRATAIFVAGTQLEEGFCADELQVASIYVVNEPLMRITCGPGAGLGFRVEGCGLRVWGLGVRVQGLGFRV